MQKIKYISIQIRRELVWKLYWMANYFSILKKTNKFQNWVMYMTDGLDYHFKTPEKVKYPNFLLEIMKVPELPYHNTDRELALKNYIISAYENETLKWKQRF